MGDTGGIEDLSHGTLGGHDRIVGGGEDGVHTSNQIGSGGDDFACAVAGLFHVGDALGIQISLGFGDGRMGVDLGVAVQQTHGLDGGISGEHHIQNEGGVQCVGNAGDGGDAGEASALGIGDGGVNDGNVGALSGGDHALGGGGGDGDDHIHAVGNQLGADLVQGSGIVVAVVFFNVDGVIGGQSQLFQLGLDGFPDLIQGGVVQLLDDGNVEFGLGAFGLCFAAGGQQGQGHHSGQEQRNQLFHNNKLL